MIETAIICGPLPAIQQDNSHTKDGAELIFQGRVRDQENNQTIVALEYEYYEGMAQAELQKLAEETVERFLVNHIFCVHRVGRVPVGEVSVQIIVWSTHRVEAIESIDWLRFPDKHKIRPRIVRETLQNKQIIQTDARSGETKVHNKVKLPPLPTELKRILPLILRSIVPPVWRTGRATHRHGLRGEDPGKRTPGHANYYNKAAGWPGAWVRSTASA